MVYNMFVCVIGQLVGHRDNALVCYSFYISLIPTFALIFSIKSFCFGVKRIKFSSWFIIFFVSKFSLHQHMILHKCASNYIYRKLHVQYTKKKTNLQIYSTNYRLCVAGGRAGSSTCEVTCRARGLSVYARLDSTLTDSAPCVLTRGQEGRCLDGVCQVRRFIFHSLF